MENNDSYQYEKNKKEIILILDSKTKMKMT